jgi:hypothetical protein
VGWEWGYAAHRRLENEESRSRWATVVWVARNKNESCMNVCNSSVECLKRICAAHPRRHAPRSQHAHTHTHIHTYIYVQTQVRKGVSTALVLVA